MATRETTGPKWGPIQAVHYYAQGYLDLEDIINTLNRMIELRVPQYERTQVKSMCSVSALPLKGRTAGAILKINIPRDIVSGTSPTRSTAKMRNSEEVPTDKE